MVFSVDKILSDLRNVPDYSTFQRIVNYVHDHASEYSPHIYDIIQDNIQELRDKKFRPKACSQIKNIYYRTREGYGSLEWIPMGSDYSVSICASALELGIPLDEYLFDLYPDMVSYKIETFKPTEFERSIMHEVFPSMEERRERKLAVKPEETTETPVSVGIDIADLLEKQRREMNELLEAAREDNYRETERLRESINDLRVRLESTPEMEEQKVKTITRILDASQFSYFQRNVIKLGLPIQQRKVARGEYEISIRVETPEQEQKALGFLSDVEEHATVSVSKGKIRPPDFEDVLNQLCQNYEKRAGIPCGLSRKGALSTLAERMIEYAAQKGTEWDKLYDIYILDLFAEPGKIYTREQADEAFNTIVRNIEANSLVEKLDEYPEECDPDNLTGVIFDFDAINVIEAKKMLSVIPDRLQELRNEAIRVLSKCKYYPNRLEDLRNDVDVAMGEFGTNYNDQLEGRIDDYLRRYREEEK